MKMHFNNSIFNDQNWILNSIFPFKIAWKILNVTFVIKCIFFYNKYRTKCF